MMTQSENQGLHKNKMIVNLQVEVQRKLKYLKKHQKVILVEALLVLLVIQRHNFFFNTIQPVSLNSYFH